MVLFSWQHLAAVWQENDKWIECEGGGGSGWLPGLAEVVRGCQQPGCAPAESSEPAVPARRCWQTEFPCWEPKGIIPSPSLAPQMGPRQLWAGGCGLFWVCPCGFWLHPAPSLPVPHCDICSSTGQGRADHAPALLLPEPALPDPSFYPKSLFFPETALAKNRGTFPHLSTSFQAVVQIPLAQSKLLNLVQGRQKVTVGDRLRPDVGVIAK